jgi:superfamily I DNA/RNA helicase
MSDVEKNNKLSVKDQIDGWNNAIPEHMLKDAFAALSLAILQEFMMSSDAKTMIFHSMIYNLQKMGHHPDDIEKFKVGMNAAYKKFHKPNSFMG